MSADTTYKDPLGEGDDIFASFQIEGAPVRGRIVRLGDALDAILKRHDYPRWAAHLLGEAVTLAVLVAASLKFDGKISVQAQGDGPVSLMVAEARTDGGVRGYVRLDRPQWDNLDRINKGAKPHIPQLFGGQGVLALMLTPADPTRQAYQGLVPLVRGSLAECAQDYFMQSEQIPTRVRLAVGEISERGVKRWRAGGALIQQVAGDDARGDTTEPWDNARHLFDTITDLELVDPDLSSGQLLFRLFHETGVRLEPPAQLADACTCSEEKLLTMLRGMPKDEIAGLADEAGQVHADCQFCNRKYAFAATDI